MISGKRYARAFTIVCLACAATARADDEIQVYNGEIADVGKWTGQHHINYAINGRKEPEFPGGLIPNHTTNATFEYAYGVTDWFEFGFYTPYAFDKDGYHSNALKLRTLWATPNAGKREFFYGLNIEYDYLMPKFADTRFGMEIRPIIGWRKGDYEFIINPIIDLSFGKNGEITFVPNARLARNFGEDLAFAIEYYTDLGPISHFLPFNEQGHNIYGVVDFKVGRFDIEFGIGYGLTNPGSDRWMTKLMITTDLYEKKDEKDDAKKPAGKSKLPTKAPPKASPTPADDTFNYAGCYGGGYFGGTSSWDIEAIDPVSRGGAVAAGAFYDAPFANAANGGTYRIPLKYRATVGGTLGCNWQLAGTHLVWGAEGETGHMRISANVINPYSDPFNSDVLHRTAVGDWYGALAGRAGWATDRALFYVKGGVGFTDLKATVVDVCAAAPCGTGTLSASSRGDTRAFWVAGAGIEWAFTGDWTIKSEYLFLALNETTAVCGPGGGTAAGATFCGRQTLDGIHTAKFGLNYKFWTL
jgi:opacity protein-like surface antigen